MKQIFPFLLSFVLLLAVKPLISQNLTFHPSDCSPGDQLQIQYNSKGTALEKVEDFDVVVYEFTDVNSGLSKHRTKRRSWRSLSTNCLYFYLLY